MTKRAGTAQNITSPEQESGVVLAHEQIDVFSRNTVCLFRETKKPMMNEQKVSRQLDRTKSAAGFIPTVSEQSEYFEKKRAKKQNRSNFCVSPYASLLSFIRSGENLPNL